MSRSELPWPCGSAAMCRAKHKEVKKSKTLDMVNAKRKSKEIYIRRWKERNNQIDPMVSDYVQRE